MQKKDADVSFFFHSRSYAQKKIPINHTITQKQ